MKKAKAEVKSCKYCGYKTADKNGICSKCKAKKRIMHGWHWLYKGKEIIKTNKGE